MFWLTFIGCSALFGPERVEADRTNVAAHLTGNFPLLEPSMSRFGAVHEAVAATVQAVRFEAPASFPVTGALWQPRTPNGVGIVVAHGHYGQGKSGAEAQEIAHRLAARGAWVLAVDSPGVEEGDLPGRQIHFSEGAHNRGILVAGGSSALELQLAGLKGAVSILRSLGATRIGVTGASGGAVASFYLGWLDDRVHAAVLASPPPIPREAAASGCACDHIPGHPGPDAGLVAQLRVPSLWMADVPKARPEGLDPDAEFRVYEGPHSYTEPMQRHALEFFEEHLDLADGSWVESVPQLELTSGPLADGSTVIADLPLSGGSAWVPQPERSDAALVDCAGQGTTIVALGAAPVTELVGAGFRVCSVGLPAPGDAAWDEAAWTESIGLGTVRANAVVGAVMAQVRRHQAKGVWAERAWGLIAGAMDLPYVVHNPVHTPADLLAEDPAWVHVPGAWNSVMSDSLSQSIDASSDRTALIDALKNATAG